MRATATITVLHSETKSYDDTLLELHLTETFAGDLVGESDVRALQLHRADGSATMVSMQRFRGALAGRNGTFVLEGHQTVHGTAIEATWTVIPHSGTGELTNLRGEGGFHGTLGTGSTGWLDYWFEG